MSLSVIYTHGFSHYLEDKLSAMEDPFNGDASRMKKTLLHVAAFVPKLFQGTSLVFAHIFVAANNTFRLEGKEAGKNLLAAAFAIPIAITTATIDVFVPSLEFGKRAELIQFTLLKTSLRKNHPIQLKEGDSHTEQSLQDIEKAKELSRQALERLGQKNFSFEMHYQDFPRERVLQTYDEMIAEFSKEHYGQMPPVERERLKNIQLGQELPPYYANVQNQSAPYIKNITLLGWRNQIAMAPKWMDDLQEKAFIAGENHYGEGKGLKAIKSYTGQVVDLEQEIILPRNSGPQEAKNAAKILIDTFKTQFPSVDPKRRNLEVPEQGSLHQASGHQDKGNHAVWTYQKPGNLQLSYFVNVPEMPAVKGALLDAPYQFAHCYLLIKKHAPQPQKQQYLNRLYAAISMKCLNDKLENIDAFEKELLREFFLTQAKETPKIQAIKKYGQSLVDQAISRNDLLQGGTLDELLPPPEENPTRAEWIAAAVPRIKQIVRNLNWMEQKLFFASEGESYLLFSESNDDLFRKIAKDMADVHQIGNP